MDNITISLRDAGLILIGIDLIILLVYIIVLVKNLVVSVKHVNRILEDTQVVSKIASEKAQHVDKLVDNVAFSVGTVTESIKGNQSVVSALTSIINAITSLTNLVKKHRK